MKKTDHGQIAESSIHTPKFGIHHVSNENPGTHQA